MKILLADDHRIVRDGLRWMLAHEPDVDIVGEATDGQELLDQLRDHPGEADIVLLDIRMPGLGGLEALEQLFGGPPAGTPAVIILSMHGEPAFVRRAIQLGASGYLLKNTTREQLLTALRNVAAGNAYIQSDVTAPLLDQVAGRNRPLELSDRELKVLDLVATGHVNKQIAMQLHITEATVKTHLKDIFARLGAANRAEAVALSMHLGLIDPS